MNPYDEKRLRDEVIYLHYLWHQGPPQNTNTNTNTHKRPRPRPKPLTQNPTNKSRRFAPSGSCSAPMASSNGHDWSVLVKTPQPSSFSDSGWPEFKSKQDQLTLQVSFEDQTRFVSLQMQKKVLECCREFFNKRDAAADDDEDEDEDEEEEEEDKEKEEGSGVNKFFMGIFVNNNELRGYYEKNHEEGEFLCLVCGGIGENVCKKFEGCVGLVQHCMSISKTKRRTGHRDFGLVVCKVLGWDVDRLPVILLKGEPLSHSLAHANESQDTLNGGDSNKKVGDLETESSDVEVKNGASNSLDKGDDLKVSLGDVGSVDASESVEREVSSVDPSNSEAIVSENSLKGDDANKNVESLESSDAEPDKAVNDQALESSQIRNTEWPCIEPTEESTSTTMEWPRFKPCTASVNHVVSAEEQIKFNMVQLQQNVFESCKHFLSATAESDSDENDNEVDEDENDLTDEDGSKECQEFNFFLKLFTENNELRSYYETNCKSGDFCCLVCCGIGKKAWRTFKDCAGLIHHSSTISKTKRKRAHRAFGQVICKVLGWDIACLPSIVLESEPQIRSNEWPCIEPADEFTSKTMEWPSFEHCTAPATHAVTAEEQNKFNMVQLQQNVFGACTEFLSTTAESDSDEDDNEFNEDENDTMDEDGSEECKEFNFFLKLFTENNELRSYYETNCRGGDFCCLVCCGIGKKAWRTFKDCVSLIHHSTTILKTKRKQAHRAFGQVICKVLDWDIAHLPSTALKSNPQNHAVKDLSQCQNDGKANCEKDEPDAPADKADSKSTSKGDIDSHQTNNMLTSSENEEPRKDDNLEDKTLDIGAHEDKAVHSPHSSMENNTQPQPESENFQVENLRVDEPEEDARDLK